MIHACHSCIASPGLVALPAAVLLTPSASYLHSSSGHEIMPSLTRSVPFSLRSTPPQLLRAGVASPPRCQGRETLPERHTCGVSAVPGDAVPRSTISLRRMCDHPRQWSALLASRPPLFSEKAVVRILEPIPHQPSGCGSTRRTTPRTAAAARNDAIGHAELPRGKGCFLAMPHRLAYPVALSSAT